MIITEPDEIKRNVTLAPFTTYKIGGPADYFFEAETTDELVNAVLWAKKQKLEYFVLGRGANILFTDKGFRGLVIHNIAKKIEFLEHNLVKAESGVVMADLILATRDKCLSGLEHFIDIPSTIGGAIWQNLHFLSPDRSKTVYISDVLDSARILTEEGHVTNVEADYFRFGYDQSVLHDRDDIVLDATFQLKPASKEDIEAVMAANLAWRREKQPPLNEYPSCGSVFKKIEGAGAGRLIDQAGLKGTTIGRAQISPNHANFIVNLGGATAKDVLDLIILAQDEVKRKFGFELEPEISVVGEK